LIAYRHGPERPADVGGGFAQAVRPRLALADDFFAARSSHLLETRGDADGNREVRRRYRHRLRLGRRWPRAYRRVGAFCTRRALVAPDTLKQCFTVVTYDRRGRGESGDTEPFTPEREYEDLAAVAGATGPQPPLLFGHSSGAAAEARPSLSGCRRS